jgi:hypothetical protein
LIDRELTLAESAVEWTLREILNISSQEVAEVIITHTDGEMVQIRKTSADETDFTLLKLPEGRELQSSWSVNSIADAFSSVLLDDVRPVSELGWTDSMQIHVITFSGWNYGLQLLSQDDGHWLQWSVERHGTAEAVETLPQPLQELTDRTAGWAFKIPAYKFESMNKRLESLLKPLEVD